MCECVSDVGVGGSWRNSWAAGVGVGGVGRLAWYFPVSTSECKQRPCSAAASGQTTVALQSSTLTSRLRHASAAAAPLAATQLRCAATADAHRRRSEAFSSADSELPQSQPMG